MADIAREISPLTPADTIRTMVYRSSAKPNRKERNRGKEPSQRNIRTKIYLQGHPEITAAYASASRTAKSKIISSVCQAVFEKKPRLILEKDRKLVTRLLRQVTKKPVKRLR